MIFRETVRNVMVQSVSPPSPKASKRFAKFEREDEEERYHSAVMYFKALKSA